MATSGRSALRLVALIAALVATRAEAAPPARDRAPGPAVVRAGGSRGSLLGVRTAETVRAPDGIGDADLVTFDEGLAPRLLRLAPEESLWVSAWPVAPGVQKDVVLTRRDVYAPDARIVKFEKGQEVELPRSRLAFFIGEIEDGKKGRVMVSIDPDTGTFSGFSAADEGYFEIVPPRGRRTRYLVASPSSLREPGEPAPTWRCGQEELPPNWGDYTPRPSSREPFAQSPPTKVAVLAIDTDNEYLSSAFSNDTTAATNYVASLVASITTIYERDALVRIYEGYTILRPSTTTDPYAQSSGGNASGAELSEFGNYWNSNYGSIKRTIATMLSGKQPSSNSASGIAWISGLCSATYGYSFCQLFTSKWLVGDTLIVAHEMGHNFGSPHTHCYSPPADTCYNAEGGCYSGTTSCPASHSITTMSGAVVSGVTGTLMSYCHMLGGCEPDLSKELVFHLRSLSEYLNTRISNATGSCIFTIGNAAPAITGLSVTSGPLAGGTVTNITGTGFRSGATVAFVDLTGSTAASLVTFNSSTSLTVKTPAHAAGSVDVVVMNPDFQTATLRRGFTYTSAPPPPPQGLKFYTLAPCRVLDTRNANGPLGGPALQPNATRLFTVTSVCGIPPTAVSISVNVAVVPAASGFFTLYPGNGINPGTSTLNFSAGQVRSNNAVLLLSTDGTGGIDVLNGSAGSNHFILDVNGYFQ